MGKLQDYVEYLEKTRIPLRLAVRTESGWPMVLSLWYLYQDNLLYCATQRFAKIVSYLTRDSRCAFEIAGEEPPYCGLRGQAKAKIDENFGVEILQRLLVRYLGGVESDLAQTLLQKSESEVAIVLEPIRIYTWDYSDRMKGIDREFDLVKVCP